MKQVLTQKGTILLLDIPAPLIGQGQVLVEVAYSLISSGTELDTIQSTSKSLFEKALEQPEKVKKLIDFLRQQGVEKTIAKINGQLEQAFPLGYSCSGTVIQVGEGITDIQPGDRVACAGSGIANHAEIVLVPRNLLAKIPEGCSMKDAASMTLGAIALQGVRRADPRLGETVAVIGLGLLGQITLQLLKAAGCRVIGLDLDDRRISLARELGADVAQNSSRVDVNEEVKRFTAGNGVDAAIITAATTSDAISQQAMELTRKKGRVVVVGAVGLGLKRSPFYEKEIDFLISCSYGPGRYDTQYEKKGEDYPYAFVRWTENRNMQEYLQLIADGKVKLDSILEREYDLSQVQSAYKDLQDTVSKPLGITLRYPAASPATLPQKLETKVSLRSPKTDGKINVALVGAGSFAKTVHLPNLQKLKSLFNIQAIVSNTGSNATETANLFNAAYATTDYQKILEDPNIDAVIICTRHDLHAEMTLKALSAGKHVLVEKPLALNQEELDLIKTFILENPKSPVLLTGFNRRFSPHVEFLKKVLSEHPNPKIIDYRMNAGYIPSDQWVHNNEGGGRNIGEACHIYDLLTYLTNAKVINPEALTLHPKNEYYSSQDNFVGSFSFDDGSLATLQYTSMGSKDYPKESMEIFVDGLVLTLSDYKSSTIYGSKMKGVTTKSIDKGHLEELRLFGEAINGKIDWPNPFWQQIQAMEMAFVVEQTLKGHK
jgi:predicted dehydrogenase/threonine dehydrogenase-like Zn-dependent dehydrogenase